MSSTSLPSFVRPTLVAMAAAACISAIAQENAPTLSEVVISASGFEQNIREAPASITVITHEQLAEKRVNNLAQALEDVEGVDVGAGTDKTGGPNISIRGMPSEYTLILIDGRRQNSAGNVAPNNFGGTQTSFIPPVSAIERIEVIRGPMSTLYGSDAMGGVINIITRKVSTTWGGSITTESTTQQASKFGGSYGGKFYLSGPIQNDLLGLALRGSSVHREASDISYLDKDGKTVNAKMGANPVQSTVNTFGARLSLTPNKSHDIVLDLESGRQTYDNATGKLGTLGTGGYAKEQKYKRDQWSLAHTGRYAFGVWETSFLNSQTKTVGRLIPEGIAGEGSPRKLETTSKVLDSKLMTPWGKHLTTIGAQYWKADLVDGVVAGKFNFTQKAIFVEDEWSLAEDFKLTLGGRYDRHNVFGGKFSPRIYGVWNTSPEWTIKGGISNGYKTPSVEELSPGINGFGRQGKLPLIGNPNLQPETSRSTEIGFHFNDIEQRYSAGVTVFHNNFKNKISSNSTVPNCTYDKNPNQAGCLNIGNWPDVEEFFKSTNIDRATTQGLELSGRFKINQAWSTSANYTYTKSEQKSGEDVGQPLTNTPKHSTNLRLEWKPSTQWSAWLRAEYRSERYRGNPNSSSASTAAAAKTLGDYKASTQFHIGGSYRATPQFTLHAAVYNLFNKNFIDYGSYAYSGKKGPVTDYSNRYINPENGRRLWISGTYEF